MKQLTQNKKTGKMEILEVPFPALGKKNVVVRNHYSVISAGTERKTVKDARRGYIGKALARQSEVKQVVESVKTRGLADTYKLVMDKLDAPSSLGYSCAGEVIDVGEDVVEFQVGDLVACGGGQHAVHAEVVSVPRNLCVKIPDKVELRYAAFTTIGAIAMQGIRQADLRIGENCVVIGLGLIGQLTLQILGAGGIQAVGIDIDPAKVELGKKSGACFTQERNSPTLLQSIQNWSGGFGSDGVIITASASSLDPVELAGAVCRKKGRIVIVGAVPTGFSRPNYYKKELELRMSCSYGPGRYDPKYEERGLDYPYEYVRWTENRNMASFLTLVQNDRMHMNYVISHTFEFEQAEEAYDLIIQSSESYLGVLLKYDTGAELKEKIDVLPKGFDKDRVNLGFIGAGSFAKKTLLPAAEPHGELVGVATSKGNNSLNIAEKFGFQYSGRDGDEIIGDQRIDTVFVATRHNLHAEYVLKCLQNNKNVFVEKPLCMRPEELEEIKDEYGKHGCHLMVGFNRRFAPLIQKMQTFFSKDVPKAINYRINVGQIAPGHWTQDKEIGGGRIIGEACHFIDLAMFLVGSKPVSVYSSAIEDPLKLSDTINISLVFKDGSIANISYFANGSKLLNKEYLEVYCGGMTAILSDYKSLYIYGNKKSSYKSRKQDKGHRKEVELFLNAVKNGQVTPIPFEDIYNSTLTTFKVIESLRKREAIRL
jgi:polar amino acid transport system substrate-binding protein